MDNAILAGDFSSFKHIKTRKVFVIEVEFPEEMGRQVLEILGMPIGGESKPVAIALLDNELYHKRPVVGSSDIPQPDLKLTTRAVMLCKQKNFQEFCRDGIKDNCGFIARADKGNEQSAKDLLCWYCNIKSRSELATNFEAQNKFKEILEEFDNWKFENQHKDNIGRI